MQGERAPAGFFRRLPACSLDAYEGYRRVYGIYLGSSGLAEELKPDAFLRVDDEFRAMIRRLADAWLRGEWPPHTA
jgi:hypothetical protein